MLRLSILLVVAMFFAWETLGHDDGQLRPGLAKAAAEGRLDEVWAEARAREAAREAASTEAEGAFVLAEPEPAPLLPEPTPAPALAAPVEPDMVVEREVVQVVADPVFTLESFGNELVPGEDEPRVAGEPEAVVLPEDEPETATPDQGAVWYVKADSVNVRAEPSTEAEILGKLSTGEALLMVAAVDDEWARIVIQGDGVEGYVASRFLTPTAP